MSAPKPAAPPLLFAAAGRFWLWEDRGRPPRPVDAAPVRRGDAGRPDPRAWAELLLGRPMAGVSGHGVGDVARAGGAGLRVGDRMARALAEAAHVHVDEAPSREVSAARERLPAEAWAADREFLLALAQEALTARLSSPEEIIISLSREGDRLQQQVRREREALGALSSAAGEDTPVAAYAASAQSQVDGIEERWRTLERRLEEATLRLLPNTCAVLGPRTAAHLLAVAGGSHTLLRYTASQVQIAGARRRRAGSPGPRHGVLYLASGMDRVPPDRRGALARSLSCWAVVALRADLLSHGSVGPGLVAKREARIESLSKGRGARPRPWHASSAPPAAGRASPGEPPARPPPYRARRPEPRGPPPPGPGRRDGPPGRRRGRWERDRR